jgi:Cu/Ag efflux protein CusF
MYFQRWGSVCSWEPLLLGTAPLPATAQNQDSQTGPSGMQATESATATATVQGIDYKNRTVTLKGKGGNVFTVQVGEEARNFNQIKRGDLVTFHYRESLALAIHKSDEPPSAQEQETLMRAQPGQMPGGAAIKTTQVTTVENINRNNREVTLRLPEGKTKTVKVGKGVGAFDRLQRGDQVVATYTEAIAIDVTRPGK